MTMLELIVSNSVAVLVGGMIPILSLYVTERIARRRHITEWFEKAYIEGCIDLLHNCFCGWAMISSQPTRSVQESLTNPILGEVPVGAASRLMTLTGSVELQNWINAMQGLRLRAVGRNDFNGSMRFQSHAAAITRHLDTLRSELLTQQMKSKSDVIGLRSLRCVTTFNATLKQLIENLISDPNVKTYTPTSGDVSVE